MASGFDRQNLLRSIFDAYPDALLVADHAGTIVLANPTAERLLAYGPGELTGLNVDVLVPDAIRPRHAAYREGYARNPRPRPMGNEMELVARRRDGSEVTVEIALSPLQNEGLPLVVASIRDIGAYPRVRRALQRARYSEHLAAFGSFAVDAREPQLLLQELPAAAARALDADAALVFLLLPERREFRVAGGVGTVAGEQVGDRLPNQPDTPPGHVLMRGEPVRVDDYRTETRFTVPPAYLAAGLASELSVLLTDRGRTLGALTVRSRQPRRFGDDETRFVQSLAHLLATSLQRAESDEALRHAQRLESVGQLTGGIAHDFNNLLTVIQGNLQVLEDLPAVAGDALVPQLVGAAMRASRRGAELTGKLLAFSRRQVLQPTEVDIGTLLQALADMLRRTLDQHIQIDVAVAPGCPAVVADPGQLESALLNIAINARDAMPDGGRLRFAAAPAPMPADLLAELEGAPAPQGYVAVSIADSGTGMSAEVRERAFEPFFTTKEAGRGTGLGLSTVYGFVKQSRGAVALTSAAGAGTTVTLYVPQRADAEAAPPEPAAAAQALPPGLKVLLVEDDAEVRAVMQRFLVDLGCDVVLAARGEQALRLLDGIELLLTDVALGAGMRGTELAAQALALRPAPAVLLMSGFPAELVQAELAPARGWELLPKPCSREQLAAAAARALRRR